MDEQLGRMRPSSVTLDAGASEDTATLGVLGSRNLTALQRAADAALYTSGATIAIAAYAGSPSVNGRRASRPGTSASEQAA